MLWEFRVDCDLECDWYLHVEGCVPHVIVHEIASHSHKHHDHGLFETDLPKKKLNKAIRASVPFPLSTMGMHSAPLEDESKFLAYLDGQVKYVSDAYKEIWAPHEAKMKAKQAASIVHLAEGSSKRFNMFEYLSEKVFVFTETFGDRDVLGNSIGWTDRWEDRQQFVRDFINWYEEDKSNWHPSMKIGNFNTFFSYLGYLWVRSSPRGSVASIMSFRPAWF